MPTVSITYYQAIKFYQYIVQSNFVLEGADGPLWSQDVQISLSEVPYTTISFQLLCELKKYSSHAYVNLRTHISMHMRHPAY